MSDCEEDEKGEAKLDIELTDENGNKQIIKSGESAVIDSYTEYTAKPVNNLTDCFDCIMEDENTLVFKSGAPRDTVIRHSNAECGLNPI